MKAGLNPSGITVQVPPVRPAIHVAAYIRSWDTLLYMHSIKQFQLLRLVLPLRFRQ